MVKVAVKKVTRLKASLNSDIFYTIRSKNRFRPLFFRCRTVTRKSTINDYGLL